MSRLKSNLIVASLIVATLTVPASAQTPKEKEEPGERVELIANADSWVDAAAPDKAYGTERGLAAKFKDGKGARILLGFEASELKGREIVRAELRMTLERSAGEGSIQFAAAGIREKWTEAEVNFTNQPPRGATVGESIITLGSNPSEVTMQVTSLLKQTLEADQPLEGIALSGPFLPQANVTYERVFRSREQVEGAPKLIVVHREKKKESEASAAGAGGVRIAIVLVIVAVLAVAVTFLVMRTRAGGGLESGEVPQSETGGPTSDDSS